MSVVITFFCKHQGRKVGRTGVRWAEKGKKPPRVPSSGPKGFALGLSELQGSGQRESWGDLFSNLNACSS